MIMSGSDLTSTSPGNGMVLKVTGKPVGSVQAVNIQPLTKEPFSDASSIIDPMSNTTNVNNTSVPTGHSDYIISILDSPPANTTRNNIVQASNQTSEPTSCVLFSLPKLPDDFIYEFTKPEVDMNDQKIVMGCLASTCTIPAGVLTTTMGTTSATIPLIVCAACTNFANFSNSCPSNEEGSDSLPQILAKQTKGCLVLPVLFKLLYDGTQSAAEEAHNCWLHCFF